MATPPPTRMPPISRPFPPSAIAGNSSAVRFTVNQALRMVEAGIVPEDATTELLHGIIVRKDRGDSPEASARLGPKHRFSVVQLTHLAGRINGRDQHVQVQTPLVCSEHDAPEPDFAIIRGARKTFPKRLPTAADVTCVVEVADSSLERDRDEKSSIYASAGVPQYVILNLRDRSAIVHAAPDAAAGRYAEVVVVPEPGAVTLRLATTTLTVSLADLFS